MRVPAGQRRRQPDQLQQLADPAGRALLAGQPEADVRGHRQVREQRALLRHVADPAVLRRPRPAGAGDGRAAERDRAGVRVVEAGDQPQQRGLAAAGRAEHGGQRARRHVQVDPTQHLGGAERLGDAGEGECRHAVALLACRVSRYVAGADSATISAAYGAAAPYARLLLWFQNSRGQRAGAERGQQQGRGQLGDHGEEDQRGAGAEAGRDQRQGHPPQRADRARAEAAGDRVEHRRRLRQRGPGGDHGPRQEQDRVAGDQQRRGLVERRGGPDRDRDQGQRDHDPGQRAGDVRAALQQRRHPAAVAHRQPGRRASRAAR